MPQQTSQTADIEPHCVQSHHASMNLWTCRGFLGHWPVGTAAIVCAATAAEGAKLLEHRLNCDGLRQRITEDMLIPFRADVPNVRILQNGDY